MKHEIDPHEIREVDLTDVDFYIIRDPKTNGYMTIINPNTMERETLAFRSVQEAEIFMDRYDIGPDMEVELVQKRTIH